MATEILTHFLPSKEPVGYSHPLIRNWDWLLNESRGDARCRIERKRQGLTYLPTKLWLELTLKTSETRAEHSDWDMELNQWLVTKKVRAVDEENESIRFQLVLRELLLRIERGLGEGYFSAVLIDVLNQTPLHAAPSIGSILSEIGPYSPYKGRSYSPAVASIKAALSECVQDLKTLEYENDAAERIFVTAVTRFLDDRFSVSNRAWLGLD